jgi:hypothetical protein
MDIDFNFSAYMSTCHSHWWIHSNNSETVNSASKQHNITKFQIIWSRQTQFIEQKPISGHMPTNGWTDIVFNFSTYMRIAFKFSTYMDIDFNFSTYMRIAFKFSTYMDIVFNFSTYMRIAFKFSTYMDIVFNLLKLKSMSI